jgi:galactokinase
MSRTVTVFAPGRVELLGNHTDYNEGLVLSAAIELGVTIEAERLSEPLLQVSSTFAQEEVSVPLATLDPQPEQDWANYPIGVIRTLQEAGYTVGGIALRASSNLPAGAGLSSSAAFEVATALAAVKLYDLAIAPLELAKLCQRAENEFVGVQCGLLDQASSVFGKRGQLILLDFREMRVSYAPVPEGVELLLLNSGVPHALTGSEYNERRIQCQAAAAALGVASLREAASEQVQRAALDPLIKRRALHITGENERVQQGQLALQAGRVSEFGRLMFESHRSSQIHFENSTKYLDVLVQLAAETPGVLGSRLSGGGFGGSTVSLVAVDRAPEIVEQIAAKYHAQTGATCTAILSPPAQGARAL